MDVRGGLLHQQGRQLQQEDPHGVRCPERVLGVDDLGDEGADDVFGVVLVRSGRSTNQLLSLVLLKGMLEARDQHVLKNL